MDLDAEVRLRVDSKDEIGDLKEQINSLYQHLLMVIADLHEKNTAVLQLEHMKVEFLRGASHELKTPVTSLKILIENMQKNIGATRRKRRDFFAGYNKRANTELQPTCQRAEAFGAKSIDEPAGLPQPLCSQTYPV